jgi:hypothetical protein
MRLVLVQVVQMEPPNQRHGRDPQATLAVVAATCFPTAIAPVNLPITLLCASEFKVFGETPNTEHPSIFVCTERKHIEKMRMIMFLSGIHSVY